MDNEHNKPLAPIEVVAALMKLNDYVHPEHQVMQ